MNHEDEIKNLLTEIRDLQREHLAEYQKVTKQSLDLQQRAVMRQEQIGKLYRRVIFVSAIVVGVIIFLVVYLLIAKLR